MNTILWILQIILCIKFVSTALVHGLSQKATIKQGIERMGTPARPLLRLFAVLMLAGSLGLILPAWLRNVSWLAPASGSLLAGLTLVSIPFHRKAREQPKLFVSLVLFALAAMVAMGRGGIF